MTTNIWHARTDRFNRIASKLRAPDWARRVARISHRLTKPDCFRCGGEDYMHSFSCTRPQSFGNAEIRLHNLAKKAAAKHEAWIERRGVEIMAMLKAAFPVGGVAL